MNKIRMLYGNLQQALLLCVLLLVTQAGTTPARRAKYGATNFKPHFDKNFSPLTLKVDENTDVGFILADISRYAKDDEQDDLTFSVDSRGEEICTIGVTDGKLRLKIVPDREKRSNYRFKIFASDNFEGGMNREASLEVYLYIVDQNDNKPIFQNTPYHVTIPENSIVGSNVVTVFATDEDAGRNKDIRYTFTQHTEHNGIFTLNPNTGVITIITTLDYEEKQQYTLDVIAKDEGVPALTTMTRVSIDVKDIGDNKPYFVKHASEKFIKENLPIGTKIAVVGAKDGDKSINNEINYDITGGDEYGLFRIDKRSGEVTVHEELDREFYTSFELQVTAYEVQQPESTAEITFQIHLEDENDNEPYFPQTNYLFRLNEDNVNAGTIISDEIKAKDDDATPVNSVLTYGMSYGSAENKYFEIRPDTGMLVLKTDVRERSQNTFSFLVYATERDTKEHYTTTANITIHIVNEPMVVPRTANTAYKSFNTIYVNFLIFLCLLLHTVLNIRER